MLHRTFFNLLFLFLATAATAQSAGWPFTAALDSIVLDPKYRPDAPGFAVMVIQDGQIVYERQRGLANLEKRLPIGPETRFNIGSITKQFTAAAIFLLEERGLLNTGDPVQRYLPELPDFGATVTLQHLLSHTSGIPDHFEVAVMQGRYRDSYCNFDKMVGLLRAAPELSFEPGSDFAYCNTAYMLLAMVVERVSGLSMHEFVSQQIFAPLGMTHSNFFQLEADGLPDGTTSYTYRNRPSARFKHTKPTPNATGATGVQTTLRDFFLWDQNFYQKRLGKGTLTEKMETSGRLNDGSATHYGGGLLLKNFQGQRMVSHGGGWSSFLMEYRRFPELGISVLVASNNDFSNPFRIADTICRRILPVAVSPAVEAVGAPSLPAAQFEGTYLSASNFIRQVRQQDGRLFVVISRNGGGETLSRLYFVEQPENRKHLLVFQEEKGCSVVFRLDSTGQKVRGFYWEGGHYFQVERFYEKLDEPAGGSALRVFTGKYRSDSRRQTIRIRQKGRRLVLKPVFFLKYPLEPLGGHAFQVRGETVVIRFGKDEMVIGNDWANGLRLKKIR